MFARCDDRLLDALAASEWNAFDVETVSGILSA
jgi:hypothetical protein